MDAGFNYIHGPLVYWYSYIMRAYLNHPLKDFLEP